MPRPFTLIRLERNPPSEPLFVGPAGGIPAEGLVNLRSPTNERQPLIGLPARAWATIPSPLHSPIRRQHFGPGRNVSPCFRIVFPVPPGPLPGATTRKMPMPQLELPGVLEWIDKFHHIVVPNTNPLHPDLPSFREFSKAGPWSEEFRAATPVSRIPGAVTRRADRGVRVPRFYLYLRGAAFRQGRWTRAASLGAFLGTGILPSKLLGTPKPHPTPDRLPREMR